MAPPQAIAGGGRSSAAAVKVPTISPILVAETAASTPSDHLTIATNGQGRNEALLRRFAGVMGLWKALSNRHMPSNRRLRQELARHTALAARVFAPEFLLTTNNQATKQIGAER
jgi:hypothetical protein